ncbi:hypothetical protein [Kutzneria sp. NPDC052558]|uniref:hypothetical protein n=1 Tax=Kutzneria sp. NPDC052558 TaxID=3364121 RepID=UPI0037C85118
MATGQPSGFETVSDRPQCYVDFLDQRTTIPGERADWLCSGIVCFAVVGRKPSRA